MRYNIVRGSRFRLPANQGWELLTADADIEGIPDRHAAGSLKGVATGSSQCSGRLVEPVLALTRRNGVSQV